MPQFSLTRFARIGPCLIACALWYFSISGGPCLSPVAAQTGKSGCGASSTLADYDSTAVQPAQVFLALLQNAVKIKDHPAAAALVSYPLRAYSGPRQRHTFGSRSLLLAHFDTVFTPKVQRAILAQTPSCLFANSQGIMIGDGEVWFNKTPEGAYAITSINVK